ncbi:MAG: DUF4957 domain-containing protein [Bacteroidales bacterium]|nr:DUF4957 domain-containing protein [Bacteroidales bacterium]
MKHKNILKGFLTALAALAVLSGCARKEWNEITELNLERCLVPGNLAARVDPTKGDVVTFEWSLNKDADGYELVVYTDEALTQVADSWSLTSGEVPFTTKLLADRKYWFTVQAYRVDANGDRIGSTLSKVSYYDGSIKTYAVKDNLYLEVKARTENSVSLAWSNEVSDYTEVTELVAVPVKGGETVEKVISDAEASAAAATIAGLDPSTEYQITLFYMSASRGSVDVWTRAEQGAAIRIATSDELKTAVLSGGNYYLAYSDEPYSMSSAKPATSLSLVGELGPDGAKPVVSGKVELTADLTEANAKLYFENIKFDGAAGSRIVEHTGGSPVLESVIFVNCEITNFLAGFFYGNNDNVVKIGTFKFDSCDMYGILGSGGDAVDIRKTTEIDEIVFVNNTMYDGIRTLFRIDASDAIKIGHIDFENNTVKNIATIDDGNNRGVFAVRVPHEMTLTNNLFLFEDGGKTGDDVDRAQLFQNNPNTVEPTFRKASGNYSYAHGKDFFTKISAQAAGFVTMNVDPCYNSKGNFFQLAAQDLIENKVGASKWWISYVEKPEDLTQHVIASAHTWNLQDASLFTGDVKNSRVRDELMLVGTEATPLNADGAIAFKQASVLTRKGVPTEGYVSFKVNAPGSVDMLLSDPDKTGASVVVALYDDNGLTVLGGAVASASNPEVQKIVVSEVQGEGTVYLYSTGAVSVTKLGWSEDTLALDKVLETPKPVVEPVTLTEGDETGVTITWEPIHAADHYVVVFNKRTQDPQKETSFTVPAEDIAELKAGLYTFTVQAFPSDIDLYYQASEKGNASFAIQPKGGGGEQVEVTLTWDFSASDWQDALGALGAAGADITNIDLTVEGLSFHSGSKSKYGATYIQFGGKSGNMDRYFKFTAPEQGTLKITSSNTGGSEAMDRTVAVTVGDDTQAQPGGFSSNTPGELEFSIPAGEVVITAPVNGLRFYKIEFTYTTGAPAAVEFDWDFAASDWQDALGALGAAGADITNIDLTVDGLTFHSGSKSKYNTTYIQFGGKSGDMDRYFKFTAPDQGTLKITVSNTGGSEALDRTVQVAVGDDVQAQPGGFSSNTPGELEFSVPAGEVVITAPVNGLRFYHIYYTNQ